LLGITGREYQLAVSSGRSIRPFRTELVLQLWSGGRFGSNVGALWDTGADLLTISEQFADDRGIDWQSAAESLGSSGTGGSLGGVLVTLTFRLLVLREVAFRVDCQVLIGSDFPRPLLGNRFGRRNFDVQTVGERRTFFKLRSRNEGIPIARLRAP
jgi:hypothetical protein